MLGKIATEFKEQPWKSTAALAGVASFFIATFEPSGSIPSANGGGIIFQLFLSILLSIGVAFGFGFLGSVLSRTYDFNSQVLSLGCIFLSALSAKATFVYWFIWPNLTSNNADFKSALTAISAIYSVIFIILATLIYWGFLTRNLTSEESKAFLFPVVLLLVLTAVFTPILDLLNMPMSIEK